MDSETGEETESFRIYPGKTRPDYFRGLRHWSFAFWGATLAVSGLALAATPPGAGGLAVALGTVFVVNVFNSGAQAILQARHSNTFTNTWHELKDELGTKDPTRAPALAGAMYLLVDKYSPVILFSNRAQLRRWGQPSSTEAVLDHLKEGAAAALDNVAGNTEALYKGADTLGKLALAKKGLESLETRWGWHWSESTWWSAALTSTSFLGAVGFWAKSLG